MVKFEFAFNARRPILTGYLRLSDGANIKLLMQVTEVREIEVRELPWIYTPFGVSTSASP